MLRRLGAYVVALIFLAGCSTIPGRIPADKTPGFFLGVWHGLISVITLVAGFFTDTVTMYATHNSGSWYDLGFLIGVVAVFSVFREKFRTTSRRTSFLSQQ